MCVFTSGIEKGEVSTTTYHACFYKWDVERVKCIPTLPLSLDRLFLKDSQLKKRITCDFVKDNTEVKQGIASKT